MTTIPSTTIVSVVITLSNGMIRHKSRKRHVQTELDLVRDKNGQRRGGAHKRTGRPPKGLRAGSPHKRRDEINPRYPQHVTLRVVERVGWLRRRHMFRAVRAAIAAVAKHEAFRIVHVSVQSNHIHLLCEATGKIVLARGVQGFQISAAKHINGEVSVRTGEKCRGQVFPDRYHVESISSVRQVRHALAYVLNNWRRHRQDNGRVGLIGGRIDPFSSGLAFPGWREPFPKGFSLPVDYEPPLVSRPQTWLLAEGWKRTSLIDVFEVPGPRQKTTSA